MHLFNLYKLQKDVLINKTIFYINTFCVGYVLDSKKTGEKTQHVEHIIQSILFS